MFPVPFFEFFEYIRNIKDDDVVDYAYMRGIFRMALNRNFEEDKSPSGDLDLNLAEVCRKYIILKHILKLLI